MKISFVLIMMLVLSACASSQRRLSGEGERTRLFPNGTYQHAVALEAPDNTIRRFNGVVRISDENIMVLGLSPVQTTLFRIDEDRATKQITTNIYFDAFKAFEFRIVEFYRILRSMLLLQADGKKEKSIRVIRMNGDKFPTEVEINGVRVHFSDFDGNDMPEIIDIRHPTYQVHVKVTGYDA